MIEGRWWWLVIFAIGMAGCSTRQPLRSASDAVVQQSLLAPCPERYDQTDKEIRKIAADFKAKDSDRTKFLEAMHRTLEAEADSVCWKTAHEHHAEFDLYYAEFDDEGNATDLASGVAYRQSEVYLIEQSLKSLIAQASAPQPPGSDEPTGLDIVVFTHGWHGNARADNNYSTEFKAMLQDIEFREKRYRGPGGAHYRTIGIEIAWRGDSFETPAIPGVSGSANFSNVWDRKIAAESVARGSVHELLAYLHEIYLENSCHHPGTHDAPSRGCGRIHLLTIGHSFGALIDFQSLVSRLHSGLDDYDCYPAYGFGDMTILLNPAFEGERYRPLFNAAMARTIRIGPYFGDEALKATCSNAIAGEVQIPTLVVLQSEGDTATKDYFPLFRRITTPFVATLSPEEVLEKNQAAGWVPAFRTHELGLSDPVRDPGITSDQCLPSSATSPHPERYCPFHPDAARPGGVQGDEGDKIAGERHWARMLLTWKPGESPDDYPNYMPLWAVGVGTEIMANHDDIWNPQIVRLISVLFGDAYQQSEHRAAPAH